MEVARDIVATITDPRSMVGPEVRETDLPFCFHSSSSSFSAFFLDGILQ